MNPVTFARKCSLKNISYCLKEQADFQLMRKMINTALELEIDEYARSW